MIGLTLLDVVGYGECPHSKTERDLVQGKTIECAFCGIILSEYMERKGADIQSKVEELEVLNHSLVERDRTKDDDAITQLSD